MESVDQTFVSKDSISKDNQLQGQEDEEIEDLPEPRKRTRDQPQKCMAKYILWGL